MVGDAKSSKPSTVYVSQLANKPCGIPESNGHICYVSPCSHCVYVNNATIIKSAKNLQLAVVVIVTTHLFNRYLVSCNELPLIILHSRCSVNITEFDTAI